MCYEQLLRSNFLIIHDITPRKNSLLSEIVDYTEIFYSDPSEIKVSCIFLHFPKSSNIFFKSNGTKLYTVDCHFVFYYYQIQTFSVLILLIAWILSWRATR